MSEQPPPPPHPVLTVEDLNQLLLFQGEILSVITLPSQENETFILVQASRTEHGNCLEAYRTIISVLGFRFPAPIIT